MEYVKKSKYMKLRVQWQKIVVLSANSQDDSLLIKFTLQETTVKCFFLS